MKKILFMCCLFVPFCAFATDMCARDDTMIMVLDYQVGGGTDGFYATEWKWWANFPYGRIAGDATCLSLEESLGQKTVGAYYGAGEYSNMFINAESGLHGIDEKGNVRNIIWCRMTHPLMSKWVLYKVLGTAESCMDYRQYCGSIVRSSLKRFVFDSIGR